MNKSQGGTCWTIILTATVLATVCLLANQPVQASLQQEMDSFSNKRLSAFDSKDHPKAKGIRLTIKFPSTWTAGEGERPNIVQKMRNVEGDVMLAIMIKDLPASLTISEKDIQDEAFRKELVKQPGMTYLKSGVTRVDNESAAWIMYKQEAETPALKVTLFNLAYYFVYKNKMVGLTYAMSGINDDPTVQKRFADYVALFQLITSSVVLPSKW